MTLFATSRQVSLVESADKYAELEKEKETLEAEIIRLREVHSQKLSKDDAPRDKFGPSAR